MSQSKSQARKAPRWFNSGRGIFKRDGGFQVAAAPLVPNWQEDTAMLVNLLNKGEDYARIREALVALHDAAQHLVVAINADETNAIDEPTTHGVTSTRLALAAARQLLEEE